MNEQITHAIAEQLVLSLQMTGLKAFIQLQKLRDFQASHKGRIDPAANDYLNRQIEALRGFCS